MPMTTTAWVSADSSFIAEHFLQIRNLTEELCNPLCTEDFCIQSMLEVSPPKWHLAHTTWFFETFILKKYIPHYRCFHKGFAYLFNSYYETVGQVYPRAQRGLLSRPTVKQVMAYRSHVNQYMQDLLHEDRDLKKKLEIRKLTEVGLHHEQQHQELLLMDIKYNFSINPLNPAYCDSKNIWVLKSSSKKRHPVKWIEFDGGNVEIGAQTREFCFDNEKPRHTVFLKPFSLSDRLVTNQEYSEFIDAGGYKSPQFWLSDGWAYIQNNNITSPLYWRKSGKEWKIFTLWGESPLMDQAPVCHVSFYEADAFARWKGLRLASEFEWEWSVLKSQPPLQGNFLEKGIFHPLPAKASLPTTALDQCFGDVWEWTQSAYLPYPGYQPFPESLGEYNGKFMCNQKVLRGGSCVTPQNHFRVTYRNFFFPHDRWPFTGIRLARDVD